MGSMERGFSHPSFCGCNLFLSLVVISFVGVGDIVATIILAGMQNGHRQQPVSS
jgi:hypothetical protein